MNELFYCRTCDIGRVDDTGGVWDMREIEKYDNVPELWDIDGGMVQPPICPVHGDEMEDQYKREQEVQDFWLGGGW